jgi:hypothetical protein
MNLKINISPLNCLAKDKIKIAHSNFVGHKAHTNFAINKIKTTYTSLMMQGL